MKESSKLKGGYCFESDFLMNVWLFVGAILAAIGVGIGALGAHSMPGYLEAKGFDEAKIEKRLEQYETAVRYQLLHSLALVAIGLSVVGKERKPFRLAAWLMVVGIVLFSGGIYAIVFFEAPTHGMVPFGGLAFIAGWIMLAAGAVQAKP
jgi:uncharacterized membrane protein YgdD (TMEM256/DUF423 family)